MVQPRRGAVAAQQRKNAAAAPGAPELTTAAETSPPKSRIVGVSGGALAAAASLLLLAASGYLSPPSELKAGEPEPEPSVELWASAAQRLEEPLLLNVTCNNEKHRGKGSCFLPRSQNRCARVVVDDALPSEHVRTLREMVEWLVDEAWGGGSGPPSVVDLHAGSISYKDKFVELKQLMDFKKINFTSEQRLAYTEVRNLMRRKVSQLFGVDESSLLHDMAFFSHINASKSAVTVHDEYWHRHVDTDQYGSYAYTTLLYLSDHGSDFDGGELVFMKDSESEPAVDISAVEPRVGRIIAFTSDSENTHRARRLKRGVRLLLNIAFTCHPQAAEAILPPIWDQRPVSADE